MVVIGLALLIGVAPALASAPPASSPRRHQVIDSFVVPADETQASALAFNLDGDAGATPDNAFGSALGTLMTLVNGSGVPAAAAAGITSGQTLNLASIAADSLAADPSVWWRSFIAKAKADPVLTGGGRFRVDGTAPSGTWLRGAIANRRLTAKGGTIPLRIALLPDSQPLTVRLIAARVKARCTANGCTAGILGGGIRADELLTALVPLMGARARAVLEAQCSTYPVVHFSDCAPDAQAILGVFDKAPTQDLQVSDPEVLAVVEPLLAPDLDLFGADGKRGTDGVDDSVSFGIGFTSKAAIFTAP